MTVNTHYPEHTRRPAARLRQRVAAVAAAAAVAVGAAAWTANGSAASDEVARVSPPGAENRVIGNGTDSYAAVVAKVAPAVVTIRSERRARQTQQRLPFMDDPRFRDFFGFGDRPGEGIPMPQPRQGGLGSGVIVDDAGHILTNHHVIEGADRVQVELKDKRTFDATVVGSDQASDLAVLKIEAENLPVVAFGDSESVNVGDVVLALGNPMGVGQTVTMGIISAKGRATGLGDGSYEDFLQTDAPINSGNSGGALVNTRGELVGINSQILSPSGGNIGIGFAIPVNMARNVMNALVEHGEVRRGRLGVTVQPITSDLAESLQLDAVAGALINDVQNGGPADRAGLQRGDVITGVNGSAISNSNELRNRIAELGPGAKVDITIMRQGQSQSVAATLEALPSVSASTTRPDSHGGERTAGLAVEPLTPERARELRIGEDVSGLLVRGVEPNGPAADAGIRAGDVIQQVDGKSVQTAADLRQALSNGERPALVLLRRGDQNLFLPLERLS
jgi:Do/DeqQ family serine protease